jgi:hypothetical protein
MSEWFKVAQAHGWFEPKICWYRPRGGSTMRMVTWFKLMKIFDCFKSDYYKRYTK